MDDEVALLALRTWHCSNLFFDIKERVMQIYSSYLSSLAVTRNSYPRSPPVILKS